MQWETPPSLYARQALIAEGWAHDVLVVLEKDGTVARVVPGAPAPTGAPVFDLLLPGMGNVHSHAFQRAMAGLAEYASGPRRDNFWSWRETMYAFAENITPEQAEAVATALYVELLKRGYTGVGEFHYLHHDEKGEPYAEPAEMSHRIVAAAQAAGIHLTLLPVLYETSNFGGMPPVDRQKRFLHTPEAYLKLLEGLRKKYPELALGFAPHSLRAATPGSIQSILRALPGFGLGTCPVHIHAAEQQKEVEDCLGWSGKRPVEWLLSNLEIDARWCFIHATHINEMEAEQLADTNAVAGLCPTTEANLGDGIFPAEHYLRSRGRFALGSDSHVSVSPWEELRQLEYAQRLKHRRRCVLHAEETASVGRTLFMRALAGGAQALGIRSGRIAPGYRADMVALSTDSVWMDGREGDALLDTLIFASTPRITDVFVNGRRVIKNGVHPLEEQAGRYIR